MMTIVHITISLAIVVILQHFKIVATIIVALTFDKCIDSNMLHRNGMKNCDKEQKS